MRVNFKGVPRSNMTPAQQVARCGLDIPPFLQRERPTKRMVLAPITSTSYSIPARETTKLFPLTDHDRQVIDMLLVAEDVRRALAKQERRANKPASVGKLRREKREGLITIGTIAAEMKIVPRVARAALRASGRVKPSFGWAFEKDEVDIIKSIITGDGNDKAKVKGDDNPCARPGSSSIPPEVERGSVKRAGSDRAVGEAEAGVQGVARQPARKSARRKPARGKARRGR